MRWGAIIEYDGTDFFGSQLQTEPCRTVQGELEQSLSTIAKSAVRVHLASRTDRGVHARGQVAAFNLATDMSAGDTKNALNHYLPDDIAVRHAQRVPDQFAPRTDAVSRTYVYHIHNCETRRAVGRSYSALVREPLDTERMQALAQHFVGSHDFAAFAGPAAPRDQTTRRKVTEITVARELERVKITISGNSFLHQQIRRMAKLLVSAAIGHTSESELAEYVARGSREAPWSDMLPAKGLFLDKILYNSDRIDLQMRLPAPSGTL